MRGRRKQICRCPSCLPFPRNLSRKFAWFNWESAGWSLLSVSIAVGCARRDGFCPCASVGLQQDYGSRE